MKTVIYFAIIVGVVWLIVYESKNSTLTKGLEARNEARVICTDIFSEDSSAYKGNWGSCMDHHWSIITKKGDR